MAWSRWSVAISLWENTGSEACQISEPKDRYGGKWTRAGGLLRYSRTVRPHSIDGLDGNCGILQRWGVDYRIYAHSYRRVEDKPDSTSNHLIVILSITCLETAGERRVKLGNPIMFFRYGLAVKQRELISNICLQHRHLQSFLHISRQVQQIRHDSLE